MTDLFEGPGPRVFALPPGVDFASELLRGLDARLDGQPPEAAARVTIFVNTRRMERRLTELLLAGPPRLMPRIKVLGEIVEMPQVAGLPPALPALDARLQLMAALGHVLDRTPDLAPRTALQDLSESLAALMDEIAGEGVQHEALATLDMGPHAAHWQRSNALLQAMMEYAAEPGRLPGAEARNRKAVDRLAAIWAETPPRDPVLVAGSTASRGATRAFMEAVARLPQGAVVLPGYDTDLPDDIWHRLSDRAMEDHPQARFAALMEGLGIGPDAVMPWTNAAPAAPERNRLISLALRPAPVTDQWRSDGAALAGKLADATSGMTLVEARSPRAEAEAIALALRGALEDGRRAALISPDRELTRQVTAALDRWGIRPDDSAGLPLNQSAPGRLLREVAALEDRAATLPEFLALLKHPLVCTGSESVPRGQHLLWTRRLELRLRQQQRRHPEVAQLLRWAGEDAAKLNWAEWICATLLAAPALPAEHRLPLADRVAAHRARVENLAGGPQAETNGKLWLEPAGEAALALIADLTRAAGDAGALDARDYTALLVSLLAGGEVRRGPGSHGDVAIWGTLEARVQGADLVVLGGLTEGTWPERPGPDPWLNRKMRADLGLLSPERRVGLAAHDFQQAVAGRHVILTRALRDEEAETVPARWINRLQNLLGGLGEEGQDALKAMRERGAEWLAQAAALDAGVVARMPGAEQARLTPARRPAPRPPVIQRPRDFAVTEIAKLIRDPYAVYARRVLRLRKLNPLLPASDPRLRGIVLHDAMAGVIGNRTPLPLDGTAPDRLRAALDDALLKHRVDPAMAGLWRARFEAMLPGFIARETPRAQAGVPLLVEERFSLKVPDMDITLTAQPDRIDRLDSGGFAILDYKTTPPTEKQVSAFDKQLPLQAAMLEAGAFAAVTGTAALVVTQMGYIGVGSKDADRMIPRETKEGEDLVAETWDGLEQLVASYDEARQGYRARAAVEKVRFEGDYDHLARFGEWSDADAFAPQDVGSEDPA